MTLTVEELRPRVPFHHPSFPVVLLWSEKSGCTTLLTWFLMQTGHLEAARAHHRWPHEWEHDVMKAAPGYEQGVVDALVSGTPAVKLVRDPFDRAVSSYLQLCVFDEDSGHFTIELRRRIRAFVYGDADVPYAFSFVDMLRWLDQADLDTVDGHLGPQSTRLEDHLADLELVRLEEFDAAIRRLEQRFDLAPADLATASDSDHHTVRDHELPNAPGSAARLHVPMPIPEGYPLPTADAFLTEETALLVERIFATDYERYGYDRRRPGTRNAEESVTTRPESASAARYRVPIDRNDRNHPNALALQLIGHDRRVLELGCATGFVTEHLVAAGNQVVGVEFDESAAAEARAVATRVHHLDLDQERVTDVEAARFDVLYAGDVLEHLRDPLATLTDALTLVDDGGDVVLSIPNAAHGDVRLHLLEGRVEYADTGLLDRTHLRWFTRASLRSMLDDAGLVAVELRRVVRPLGGTSVPTDLGLFGADVVDFIRADPDHDTVQFVVRCRRRAELVDDDADALASVPHDWPEPSDAELRELRAYAHHLRVALDTWEHSRLAALQRGRVRLTTAARRLLRR
ncbi:MAG: class I SAM-dependent methyltransferase [Actinomycetota bacterium]